MKWHLCFGAFAVHQQYYDRHHAKSTSEANLEIRFERTAKGESITIPPTGTGIGKRNTKLTQRLVNWADAE